ncbi:DUF4439 domain-containing protein, partial [Streptomyces sp. NPDC006184]|uniref:DUF4439 domain-containing protein n=1 Tax=Streptomyces sp. NPDC006184 TaxID=3155455 RepID=UPI0033A97CA0
MSDVTEQAELTALQAALAAEHAAVYGYGVVGGRVGEQRRSEVQAGHRHLDEVGRLGRAFDRMLGRL